MEHLVEHTFAGCEDHGFACYICSSVFTSAAGLIAHIQDHGDNSKPYDCNQCSKKFFFRAELENHSFSHSPVVIDDKESRFPIQPPPPSCVIKDEKIEAHDDDEEYIEIEDKIENDKPQQDETFHVKEPTES